MELPNYFEESLDEQIGFKGEKDGKMANFDHWIACSPVANNGFLSTFIAVSPSRNSCAAWRESSTGLERLDDRNSSPKCMNDEK